MGGKLTGSLACSGYTGSGIIMRELRAFLLAPIPAAALGAIVSWASGGFPRPASVAIFYLLLLYAAQLLFGVAIHAYLLRTNRRSAAGFTIGGTFMTAIPTIPYMAWAITTDLGPTSTGFVVLVLWLLLGALTGLTYWWLTRQTLDQPATA
jgi:hypothetical protein